jgi:hypothetical protein
MGNTTVNGEGKRTSSARVEVDVLKNDLETSAQR